MAESYERLSPEFALVHALETVPALTGRVASLQPPKNTAPPFCFYIPTADSEDQDLDGPTGLQKFSATVHIVCAKHRALMDLSQLAKAELQRMRGGTFTIEAEEAGARGGRVLIEDAEISQSSPDLYETEVGYFRRIYTVEFDYQTEEVWEEVISG